MSSAADEAKVEIIILPVPAKATIEIDVKLIEQVLINLINNSIHALQGIKDPVIKMECFVNPDKTVLMVSDNGKGIEDNIVNQIFIPFYTTKKQGSGIGLSLSKNILKKHGGNLLVSSEVGVKTAFSLVFKN
jgi:two-component system nitrogen regulation sensor histidine kinase NtrY